MKSERHSYAKAQSDRDVLLTAEQAASYLRLSKSTLARLRYEGRGPRYVKTGPQTRCRVLYHQTDIDRWLEQRRRSSTSEPL